MTGLNVARALAGASTKYHNPFTGVTNPTVANFNTRYQNLDAAMSNIVETTIAVTVTAGEAVTTGETGYVRASDGKAYLIDVDDATPAIGTVRGFFTADASVDDTVTMQVRGVLDGFTGLTAGALVYASATAGGYTQTRPEATLGGAQVVVVILGVAISATEVYVRRQNVLYQKRALVTEDDTLAIVHAPDANGYGRDLWAYVTTDDAGTINESRIGVGWWNSTHADVVNRYGNTSNANLETVTTFKCVAVAGFDDLTVIVEMP